MSRCKRANGQPCGKRTCEKCAAVSPASYRESYDDDGWDGHTFSSRFGLWEDRPGRYED